MQDEIRFAPPSDRGEWHSATPHYFSSPEGTQRRSEFSGSGPILSKRQPAEPRIACDFACTFAPWVNRNTTGRAERSVSITPSSSFASAPSTSIFKEPGANPRSAAAASSTGQDLGRHPHTKLLTPSRVGTRGRRPPPPPPPQRASHDRHVIAHSPTRSTARNASCGISTVPTCFIRFFPSFCFSRSFRFREMSPP